MRKGECNLCKKKTLKIKVLKKPNKSLFDCLMYYIIEVFKKDSDKFDKYTVYLNLEFNFLELVHQRICI